MITVNYAGYLEEERPYTRVLRPGGSGDYLLLYFLAPMYVAAGDELLTADSGTCLLFRPEDTQDYSAVRDFRLSFIRFSVKGEDLSYFGLPANEIIRPKQPEVVHQYFRNIQTEFFTRAPYSADMTEAYTRQLLIYLSREIESERLQEADENHLYNLFCQARYTLLSNCEREWTSVNMCEMVSLSRSQFYKYYREYFGVSPMADLQAARIEKACHLLTNRRFRVTEVAEMCGYQSIHHFSRSFKEHTGLSPLAYMKQTGASAPDTDLL